MEIAEKIRDRALRLGFQLFGVADSHVDDDECLFFNQWLKEGMGADMSGWLGRGEDKRCDLCKILPRVKSVVVVGLNYYQTAESKEPAYRTGRQTAESKRVARYAWGDDYHKTMGEKLEQLREFVRKCGDPDAMWYVDTGAVFERYFAVKAGLGFIGKNTCLITPEFGSWVFIGTILTCLDLKKTDTNSMGSCGDCRRCLDTCPTGALSERCLDARKCISYLTIEKKGGFTPEEAKMVAGQDFCFGCDVCQEVCPHNCRQQTARSKEQRRERLIIKDIPEDDEKFGKKFANSPIERAKATGMRRNLEVFFADYFKKTG